MASGVRWALLQPPLPRRLLEPSLATGRVWLPGGTWDVRDARDISPDIGWGAQAHLNGSWRPGGCIKSQIASSEEGNRSWGRNSRSVVHLPVIFYVI